MNAAELPDSTEVYVAGFGVTTAGALRSPLLEAIDAEGDAALRRWLFFTLYQPTKPPWPSGPINVGGKEYPQSVFMSDRLVRLYTSSGVYEDIDINDASALKVVEESVLRNVRRWNGRTN